MMRIEDCSSPPSFLNRLAKWLRLLHWVNLLYWVSGVGIWALLAQHDKHIETKRNENATLTDRELNVYAFYYGRVRLIR